MWKLAQHHNHSLARLCSLWQKWKIAKKYPKYLNIQWSKYPRHPHKSKSRLLMVSSRYAEEGTWNLPWTQSMNHLAGPGMRNLLSVTHSCENHQAPPGDENYKSIFFSCASGTVLIKKINLSHDLNISSWNFICVCGQEIEELTKSCPWRSTCVRRPSQRSKSSWKVKVNLIVQGKWI